MPDDPRCATSYDEIVRRTVLEPDSSFRAPLDEQHQSRHRAGKAADHLPHAPTVSEQDTLVRVRAALVADPSIELSNVRLAMDGRELVLHGSVPGPSTSARIEGVAGTVRGVDRIDNQLFVRGPR